MSTTKIKVSNIASVTGTGNVVLSSSPTFTGTTATANVSYTGTLTGSTGILNIGSGQLYKDASGNVGIGTSSPARRLHAYGTGTTIKAEGSGTNVYMQLSCNSQSNANSGYIGYDSSSNLLMLTNDTERMRIDSSGRVLIPNQPVCRVGMDGGWRSLNSFGATNTAIGVLQSNGTFYQNRGGFYAGGSLAGFPVCHVPVAGYYSIYLSLYVQGNTVGRVYVSRNQSNDICFIEISSASNDGHRTVTGTQYFDANDYINLKYHNGTVSTYWAFGHSELIIKFLG